MRNSIISHKTILLCAEYYLLLPVLLWLCGWFQPWLAYPLAALLLAVLFWHTRQTCHSRDVSALLQPASKPTSLLHLAVYVVLCAACVFLIGFDGRIVQSYDLIVRNPLYDEIIRQEWPVQMPDGRYVVYALMFWLPAGLLSSWFPACSCVFLQLWCFLGMLLICLALHSKLGVWRTLFFWGAILFVSPLTGTVDDVLNTVFIKDAVMGVHFRMPSPLTQFFNTFHYFIPTCLVLSVLMPRKCPLGPMILIASCFAVLHPMIAATTIPFLLLMVYRDHCTDGLVSGIKGILSSVEIYPCLLLVAAALVFYGSVSGCWFAFTFNTPYASEPDAFGVFCCIASILLSMLLPLAVYWCNRNTYLLVTACLCPVLILIWYGADNGVNEWMYKFSVLYGFVIVYFLASAPKSARLCVVLGAIALASTIPFLREMKRKNLPQAATSMFSVQERNFRHEWAGTMFHPESPMYFPLTSDGLSVPGIFREGRQTSNLHGDAVPN